MRRKYLAGKNLRRAPRFLFLASAGSRGEHSGAGFAWSPCTVRGTSLKHGCANLTLFLHTDHSGCVFPGAARHRVGIAVKQAHHWEAPDIEIAIKWCANRVCACECTKTQWGGARKKRAKKPARCVWPLSLSHFLLTCRMMAFSPYNSCDCRAEFTASSATCTFSSCARSRPTYTGKP